MSRAGSTFAPSPRTESAADRSHVTRSAPLGRNLIKVYYYSELCLILIWTYGPTVRRANNLVCESSQNCSKQRLKPTNRFECLYSTLRVRNSRRFRSDLRPSEFALANLEKSAVSALLWRIKRKYNPIFAAILFRTDLNPTYIRIALDHYSNQFSRMFVAHRDSPPLAAERLFGRSIDRSRRGGKRGGDRAVREPISDLSSIRLGAGRPRCNP